MPQQMLRPRLCSCSAGSLSKLRSRMAVSTAVPADHDPLKGLGPLIWGLVALHIAAFAFWVWKTIIGERRTKKVAID